MSEETSDPKYDATEGEPDAPSNAEDGQAAPSEVVSVDDAEDEGKAPQAEPVPEHWSAIESYQRNVIVAVMIAMALAYLLGVTFVSGLSQPLVQGDARAYFAYLPSLVLDGDLDLTNQFDVLRPEGDTVYPFGEGINDYAANPFPVGPALLLLPGYLLGYWFNTLAAAAGFDTGNPGYGLGAVWGAVLCGIALAGAGAELSRRCTAQLVGPAFALPATLLIWVGTPALYYTMVSPLYSHAAAWFAVALMFWLAWLAVRNPSEWTRWLAAGAGAGFLVGIRLQDAPLALVSVALLLLSARQNHSLKRSGSAWLAGAVLGYLPQGLTWLTLHGEWIPRQNLGSPGTFSFSRLWAVLFSFGHEGWLTWTPLAALAVAGLVLKACTSRSSTARLVAWSAVGGIVALVIIDVVHPYGQGAAFGARRYVSVTPFLIVGLGQLIVPANRADGLRRPVFAALIVLALTNLWLFTAYELLAIRHGVYGSLAETWRYALGMWTG